MEVRHRKKHNHEEHTTLVENDEFSQPNDDNYRPQYQSDPTYNNYASTTMITYNPMDLIWKTKEYVFEYLSYMVEFLWKQVMNCVPVYTPQIDAKTRIKMEQFRAHISTPYNKDNSEHEQLLMDLWKVTYPSESLDNRISQKWKQLGFQGTDPMTDFRGAGIFGLNSILYLARTYPARFSQMVHNKASNGTTIHQEHYPFAITGMNITMLILDILGWGMKSSIQAESKAKYKLINILFTAQDDATHQSFHEIYCMTFHYFDLEWKKQNAKYFDFPKVLEAVKKQAEVMLAEMKHIDQIVSHNKAVVDQYLYIE